MWTSCNLNNWGEQLKVLCLFLLLPSSEVKMEIFFLNVSGLCLTKPILSEVAVSNLWSECSVWSRSTLLPGLRSCCAWLSLLYSTVASRTLPATSCCSIHSGTITTRQYVLPEVLWQMMYIFVYWQVDLPKETILQCLSLEVSKTNSSALWFLKSQSFAKNKNKTTENGIFLVMLGIFCQFQEFGNLFLYVTYILLNQILKESGFSGDFLLNFRDYLTNN